MAIEIRYFATERKYAELNVSLSAAVSTFNFGRST